MHLFKTGSFVLLLFLTSLVSVQSASVVFTTLEYKNSTYHGEVKLIQRFDGLFPGDVPHGRGTMKYTNGDQYNGDYVDGVMSGFGTFYSWSDFSLYVGSFKNNARHGKGNLRYELPSRTREQYDGDWVAGRKSGYGVLKFANGDDYTGTFLYDLMHGQGILREYKGHGYFYFGNWVQGKKNGQFVVLSASSFKWRCNCLYKNDILQGNSFTYKACVTGDDSQLWYRREVGEHKSKIPDDIFPENTASLDDEVLEA